MTTLICHVPKKLASRVEKLARQAKLPRDKFVRKALEQAVRASDTNGVSGSAFSLVAGLSGSLSGPSDLATNPKYLEGLGG